MMNFLSPRIILSLSLESPVPPSWAVTIFLSQTPCGAACARNTFASRRSVMSCMTSTLFGAFLSVLATAHRTPPIALLLSVSRRVPADAAFKRVSMAMRAHTRQSDPPCPSTGTMIRLRKSVLFRRISCTQCSVGPPLLAPPHCGRSLTLALVHALSLPFLQEYFPVLCPIA